MTTLKWILVALLLTIRILVTASPTILFVVIVSSPGYAAQGPDLNTEVKSKNPYSTSGAPDRETALKILREAQGSGDLKLMTGRDLDLSGIKAEDLRLVKKGTAKAMLYRLGGKGKAGVDQTVKGPFKAWSVTVDGLDLFVRASCGNPGLGTEIELEGPIFECPPCKEKDCPILTPGCPDCALILAEVNSLDLKLDEVIKRTSAIETKLDRAEEPRKPRHLPWYAFCVPRRGHHGPLSEIGNIVGRPSVCAAVAYGVSRAGGGKNDNGNMAPKCPGDPTCTAPPTPPTK